MTAVAEHITRRILEVLPQDAGNVTLHEPEFTGNELEYVADCIKSGWVSSVGKYVDRFERELEAFTGVKHAVAVVNGTAALHICLKLVGVEPGDEVLVPALTFIATTNAVSYCGAVPHFVESEALTLGMDAAKLDSYLKEISHFHNGKLHNRLTGRPIKAVVPMHTFGHPVQLAPLLEVCDRYGLKMIEDAAESLGSYYQGKHTGHFGLLSALSFNGNKVVTTGGGGAILTNNPQLAAEAKHLTTTAKIKHQWAFIHDRIGYNYRMPNLNAALGVAQLENLPRLLENKRKLSIRYQSVFKEDIYADIFCEANFARSNYWLNALLLKPDFEDERDAVLAYAQSSGLMVRPVWTLNHKLDMYKTCPKMDVSVAESLEKRIINLPSSGFLGADHE